MTVVQRFLVGEQVVAHVVHVEGALPANRDLREVLRDVPADNHGLHTGHGFRRVRVNRDDARVRMRTAQHGSMQHAWQREIGSVVRATGDLVEPVVANGPSADVFELFHLAVLVLYTRRISREPQSARSDQPR